MSIVLQTDFSRFCQPPFCHASSSTPGECRKKCTSFTKEPAKYETIRGVCPTLQAVAIKTIRYWKLVDLGPFLRVDYENDFKAIVLLRDPRSMYHSRKQLHMKNTGIKQIRRLTAKETRVVFGT